MRVVFADTFYWIALNSSYDSAHDQATALSRTLYDSWIITTEFVVIEYLNYFAERGARLRLAAVHVVRRMPSRPNLEVIPFSPPLLKAGMDLYAARPDKGYSLIDCISMVVMRQRGIHEALTNDRHFEQEGFSPLFRSIVQ